MGDDERPDVPADLRSRREVLQEPVDRGGQARGVGVVELPRPDRFPHALGEGRRGQQADQRKGQEYEVFHGIALLPKYTRVLPRCPGRAAREIAK